MNHQEFMEEIDVEVSLILCESPGTLCETSRANVGTLRRKKGEVVRRGKASIRIERGKARNIHLSGSEVVVLCKEDGSEHLFVRKDGTGKRLSSDEGNDGISISKMLGLPDHGSRKNGNVFDCRQENLKQARRQWKNAATRDNYRRMGK